MISISQAVRSLNSAGSPSSVQLSRTALIASALPPAPSAVVSLGNVLNAQVLYTASGLLVSSQSIESGASASNNNTTVEPTSDASPALAITATAEIASVAVESVQNTAVANAGTEVNSVTTMSINPFSDPEVDAQTDLITNPIQGGLASSLNVNAAIYRVKQLSSASLVNAIEVPGPVTLLNSINVDIADLNQNPSGDQRRRTTGS